MPPFDLATLSAPLPQYFTAEAASTAALFAPDALVRDEGETHIGDAAIAAWRADVEKRYQPRYEVTGADVDGERSVVSFIVSGTFPGSPAKLRQAFTIQQGRIVRLETL